MGFNRIILEGELENSNWEDNNGNKRYDFIVNVSSMQMLDSKGDNQEQPQSQAPQQQQSYQAPQQQQGYGNPNKQQQAPQQNNSGQQTIPQIDIDEDEIPF